MPGVVSASANSRTFPSDFKSPGNTSTGLVRRLAVIAPGRRKGRPALSSDKSGQDFASTEANVTAISVEHDQGARIGSDSRHLELGQSP
jgi:hypothetical protein